MHDAHYHYSKEINALQNEYGISGICNVANEIEFELVHQKQLFYSCGVHPWNASLDTFESMLPLLKKAPIIGEIGMDSVWCDLDLNIQKEVFEKQLQLAHALNKPVILHTKGQEKTILELIRKYPNTYVVHWYGCMDYVKEYDEVVSYFTIGPSIGKEEEVTHLVKQVSMDKLLMESDGIEAVKWAIDSDDYIAALKNEITMVASLKNQSYSEVERILDQNFSKLSKRQIGPILKERSLCEIIEPQGGRIFMPGTSKVDWMHMFAEQESSELSISQYCKLHGISDKAFYNARSRYKKTDETPSLVAVEVSDDTGSSNTGCISFKLNGMSFEFDESAPDSDIQRIIKICLSL